MAVYADRRQFSCVGGRVFVVAALVAIYSSANGQPPANIAKIREAWQARQEKIASAQFVWLDERTDHAGSLPSLENPGKRFPETSVTNQVRNTVTVVGPKRFRHTRTGATWDPTPGSYIDREYTTAFDGEITTSFYGKAKYGADGNLQVDPTGFVSKRPSYADEVTRYTLPVLVNLRPLADGVASLPPEATVLDETVQIDNTKCIVVSAAGTGRGFDRKYFLDPARGFLILRLENLHKGTAVTLIDISYDEDARHGWLPVSWTVKARHPSGDVYEHTRSKVQTRRINDGIAETDVSYEFPVDTIVTDRTNPEIDVYLTRPGGAKRIVTREEQLHIATFDELVRTESGQAIPEDYLLLAARAGQIRTLDETGQVELIHELTAYFSRMPASRRHLQLARQTADRLKAAGKDALAVDACHMFSNTMGGQPELAALAAQIAGEARRVRIIGNPLQLDGVGLDDKPLDWKAFRGKVVLIDFWYMGCKPCVADLPTIKATYDKYRGRGFEVIGITPDRDAAELRDFLLAHDVSWRIVYTPEGEQPTIARYGISAFPTYFLIDADGKVTTTELEADQLPSILEKMLPAKDK
jgi:thiol-disulfide isomerase/thioredoxin